MGINVELSLIMVKKEILRVADYVDFMIKETKNIFRSKDSSLIDKIQETDSFVDILHQSIIPFLARLSQEELTGKESVRCMNYMYIQNDLESIGDVIDKNIMVLAKKKIEQKLVFSEDGFHELEHLLYKLNRNYENVLKILKNEDFELAKELKDSYNEREEEKYKKLHMERLSSGREESIATSSVHLDLINYFTKINGHITYIADRMLWLNIKKKALKHSH